MQIYRNGKEAPLPTKPFTADGVGIPGSPYIYPRLRVGDRATFEGKAYRVTRVTVRNWTEDDAEEWPGLTPDDRISVVEMEPV